MFPKTIRRGLIFLMALGAGCDRGLWGPIQGETPEAMAHPVVRQAGQSGSIQIALSCSSYFVSGDENLVTVQMRNAGDAVEYERYNDLMSVTFTVTRDGEPVKPTELYQSWTNRGDAGRACAGRHPVSGEFSGGIERSAGTSSLPLSGCRH